MCIVIEINLKSKPYSFLNIIVKIKGICELATLALLS